MVKIDHDYKYHLMYDIMYNSFIPYMVTIYTVNINHLVICGKDRSWLNSFVPHIIK